MTEHLVEVYIDLLEEGTDTIRPTKAIVLGNGHFKLLPTPKYDPIDEIWEFFPGSIVKVRYAKDDSGEDLLIACEKVSDA